MQDRQEQFAVLREAVAFLDEMEKQIRRILGTPEEFARATRGQRERHRLCMEAVVRLRRQVAPLVAEIALGPGSEYAQPRPFPRQQKAAVDGSRAKSPRGLSSFRGDDFSSSWDPGLS